MLLVEAPQLLSKPSQSHHKNSF